MEGQAKQLGVLTSALPSKLQFRTFYGLFFLFLLPTQAEGLLCRVLCGVSFVVFRIEI
jgi:hypothetical protein